MELLWATVYKPEGQLEVTGFTPIRWSLVACRLNRTSLVIFPELMRSHSPFDRRPLERTKGRDINLINIYHLMIFTHSAWDN